MSWQSIATTTPSTPAPAPVAGLVRQSGQSRHDGALSGALPQFRPDARGAAIRQADHRHRPDRARTFRPATAITSCLAERVREGIREAGGIAIEFPVHPIQETGKRPTAGLDRNLAYLGLVEVLYGYPLDGVVLTIGCDKTTPACLMAAATVNIPAIALSVGPMLNGWHQGERTGSGTIVWKARQMMAAGEIDYAGIRRAGRVFGALDRLLQHDGHGDDDELAGRGARHAAARRGRHPRALSRAPADRLSHRQAHRRHGARGPEAVRHHDARTPSATPSSSIRRSADRPMRRSISPRSRGISASTCRSPTGRPMATRYRCWSICSRPATIWARIIITPAACPPWSTS